MSASSVANASPLPALQKCWSKLTWKQLCQCWEAKIRYGGNPDVARAAALLSLAGLGRSNQKAQIDSPTGETRYTLYAADGRRLTVTPRELAWMAKKALPWFDFPYGDQGEPEQRNEQGKITKEGRDAVSGYVSGFRDAMILPETEIVVVGDSLLAGSKWESMSNKERKPLTLHSKLSTLHFALPQTACNNITWQQYRSMQALAPQLFHEENSEEKALDLKAQFLAHCLVPSKEWAVTDDRFRPRHIYRYDTERAEQTIPFWKGKMKNEELRMKNYMSAANSSLFTLHFSLLFHICFQTYHTAVLYYEKAYPLLFTDSGKSQEFRDALQGEVGTVNSVMKYQGYSDPQQVYDANLPIILDTLNTMAKEAKEIEKMNAKIKRK